MLSQLDTKVRQELLQKNGFCVSIAGSRATAMHGHDFLEFSFVSQGRLAHEIAGHHEHLGAGDYFIVDHGTQHSYRQAGNEPLQVVNLLFYPEFLERTLAGSRRFEDVVNSYLLRFRYEALQDSPTGKTFHDDDGRIRQIVESLLTEYDSKAQGYIEYCRCLLVELLIHTMRKIGSSREEKGISEPVKQVMAYVREHYADDVQLGQLAERQHYTLSGLSRKFTDEVGVSFSRYLQRIRVEQSCRLLENTDLRVSEIAAAVGYDNVKFFNQIFKQTLRISPRQFRQMRK
jgi:AraC-like DNA-binding protein